MQPVTSDLSKISFSRSKLAEQIARLSVADYTVRIQKQPDCASAYVQRANSYHALNEDSKAEADRKMAASLSPATADEPAAKTIVADYKSISIFPLIIALALIALVGVVSFWIIRSRPRKIE